MSLISLLPLRLRAPRFQRLRLPLWLTSLRGNFILFLLLFCLLQCAGIVLLTRQVDHTSQNVMQAQIQRERLTLLDKARIELLTASDNSHRAGIYLMQDQQSGSVDSWKSLAATADASLKQAQSLFAQYGAAPESELHQSFTLLVDGLNEQLKGLADNDMDSFFMVPMQAFQQQFNDAWFNEMKTANQQVAAANGATLASLTQSRNLSLAISTLLFALLMAAGGLLLRGVIAPLRQAARQLQNIATGNLIPHGAQPRRQSQETRQLFLAMEEMRQGLQHIVLEINTIAHAVSSGAAQMQQHNDSLSEQHQAQNATFSHLSQRLHRVAEEVENSARFSQQATEQAQSADTLTRNCAQRVDEVEKQMQEIVEASGEIAGIVTLLDGLSLQTRLLALNAAIESAHAGLYGRSFSVVAKEIGLLSDKSGRSTRQIDGLIQNTQQHISQGFNKVKLLETLFHQISDAVVNQLNDQQQNATAQSARVNKITQQILALDTQVQRNASMGEQNRQASEALMQQAVRLAQSVAQFCLERPAGEQA
ncbi:methyl-accepting chemotaxis protein [Pantoea sp.]|uniref:methyl-accepting chemotaxis protein n=1 Tax=Pantoea sp. TaxID=69393 RepID=UPI0028998A54|nr:methyl-accepting chemotaxis protein [Pantoea sp.]